MVNLILISTTLWRNWKRFFLFFYRFCSFSLSQHPFRPSAHLLAEGRAPRLHAAGLRGHVGTSLTALCRPQRRRASFRRDCETVSPAPRWTHHQGQLLGWCERTFWKKQREKEEKENHNPLNSQLRNLLLGRRCSHNSELHILLTYVYSYGCTECGVCLHPFPAQWREVSAINKYIKKWMNEQRIFQGWPWDR